MAGRLAVLAGRGTLPGLVIEAAISAGRDLFVLAFEGETDPVTVEGRSHAWVSLGAVGRAIKLLHQAKVQELVMIGRIDRPALSQLKLDLRGMQVLAKIGLTAAQGDDRILKVLVRELEGEGFHVLGVDQVLAPLVAPDGVLTQTQP